MLTFEDLFTPEQLAKYEEPDNVDDEDNDTEYPTSSPAIPSADDIYDAVARGTSDGIQQAVQAAGQFGNNLRYSSAGWMDKLKSAGRSVGTNLGDRIVQAVANQGGVTGLLNSPSGMLDAVKTAAMQGVQAALPDVASTVMAAARYPASNVSAHNYARDENGMPDPLSFAAAVYKDAWRRNPPASAMASGRFRKATPLLAKGQFRQRPSASAAGFWDTLGDVASKAAPFAPLLLLWRLTKTIECWQ